VALKCHRPDGVLRESHPHDTAPSRAYHASPMSPVDLLQANLLSPIVLAFALGAIATLIRSDLRFPGDLYTGLSIYLLLAIGLKGGVALAQTDLADFYRPALATLALGVAIPLWSYAIARHLGRMTIADAAAMAAHYGSVSAVTFIAAQAFMDNTRQPYEAFLPTLVALLEVPAIIIALIMARLFTRRAALHASPDQAAHLRAAAATHHGLGEALHEVLAGRSIVLLVGGIVIGFLAGPERIKPVEPVFMGLFRGLLLLFLLEMGMVAARRLGDLRRAGAFLVAFAILMPIVNGGIGVLLGHWAGMQVGGAAVLGVLAASASYIAAPAAVRIALPEANPSYYLTASLAITFPFNLTIGIPLYDWFSRWLAG
jgi:uncharacterized protein